MCDWNLSSNEQAKPSNIFQSFYSAFNQKQAKSLFESLINSEPKNLKPSLNLLTIIAFILALVVYLMPLIFAFLGFWLLSKSLETIFLLPPSLIFLLLAWVTRPRITKKPLNVLAKNDFPVLHDFVDSIAKILKTESPKMIVFDQSFNASFGQVGWKSEKVLTIGLPLWTILSDKEKIALISHELSHGINGDVKRGSFVGGALHSLAELYNIICPDRLFETGETISSLLFLPINIILLLLSYLILFIVYIFAYLLFFDSQKAEYLADYLATKVCGTEAMINMLKKCQLGVSRFEFILQRYTLKHNKFDLFKILKKDFDSVPTQEIERIRRIGELEELSLDETHPPTMYRAKFLQKHFETGTKLSISEDQQHLLAKEISKIKDRIQADAIDYYRYGLYYH